MEIKISCPHCQWEPDGGAYWECTCGHTWDTFSTGGKCPQCNKVWADTQCPDIVFVGGCSRWSPHVDWYRNLEDKIRKELEEVVIQQKNLTS